MEKNKQEELLLVIEREKKKLHMMKNAHILSPLSNSSLLKKMKKNIARFCTKLNDPSK